MHNVRILCYSNTSFGVWVNELYFSSLSTCGKCWRTWPSYTNFCKLLLSNIPSETLRSVNFCFCVSTTLPRQLPLSLRITVYRIQLTKGMVLKRLAWRLRRHSWRKRDRKTHTAWVKLTNNQLRNGNFLLAWHWSISEFDNLKCRWRCL